MIMHKTKIKQLHDGIIALQEEIDNQTEQQRLALLEMGNKGVLLTEAKKTAGNAESAIHMANRESAAGIRGGVGIKQAEQELREARQTVDTAQKAVDVAAEFYNSFNRGCNALSGTAHNMHVAGAAIYSEVLKAEMASPGGLQTLAMISRWYSVRAKNCLPGFHPVALEAFLQELTGSIPGGPDADQILQEYLQD